ncbi:MAG: glycine zipper 2TM domain-containing protein [Betaproteobacteria bacterium]|nr:glycine zipper 2TM domain-containing protein [Betaproteobacteria bacterium]
MNRIRLTSIAVAAVVGVSGCAAPGLGGGNYSRAQVRGEQSVRLGVVEGVRDVVIDARDTGTGTLAGAALGGVAGSTLGRGDKAGAAGAIAGAVVGGLIGSAVEKSSNDRRGIEVTIRLEGGNLIAITQEKDEEFRVGDRVRVLSSGRTSRVTHL